MSPVSGPQGPDTDRKEPLRRVKTTVTHGFTSRPVQSSCDTGISVTERTDKDYLRIQVTEEVRGLGGH